MKKQFQIEFDRIIQAIRANPVHMVRLLEHMEQSRQKWEEMKKKERENHQEGMIKGIVRKREFLESVFFEPDEDITIYLDFENGLFHHPPVEEMRKNMMEPGNGFGHAHEFFEMFYIYSGHCYCYFGGKEYDLPQGTVWIFNTQATHNIVLADDNTNLINILVRKTTFSKTLLSMMQDNDLFLSFFMCSLYRVENNPTYMQFNIVPGSIIEEYIYKIMQEYHQKDPYYQSIMKHQFCCLLTELTRQYHQSVSMTVPEQRPESLDISQVIAYISYHCITVTLQETASYFHYNPNYISRFIQKHTKKNFSELVTSLKMEKSSHYLSHTDFTMEEIALMVGYSERGNFEKAFKRCYKTTPAQYRKMIQKH